MTVFKPAYMAVPDTAHPLVKQLFQEMDRKGIALSTMAERSGVDRNTIGGWRGRRTITLLPLETCLKVVDLHLIAVQHPQAVLRASAELAAMRMALSVVQRSAENILKVASKKERG